MALTDAIEPTDSLRQTPRRPRHVDVHDEAAPLVEVESLCGGVCCQQHVGVTGTEAVGGQLALVAGLRAVDARHRA